MTIKTLDILCAESCKKHSDIVYLRYKAGSRVENETFSQFHKTVRQWAHYLYENGVREGDRVAIISEKNPGQIRAFYAIWAIGAIAVPICEVLGKPEMEFVLCDCAPKKILVHDKIVDSIKDRFGEVTYSTFDEIIDYVENHDDPTVVRTKESSIDDPSALIYTSGSTGMPKGVILTHRNLYVNATSADRGIGFDPSDTVYSMLPYWHSFALTVEVVMGMYAGFNVAFARDRRDFLKSMTLFHPTVILAVPRILETLKAGILKKIDKQTPLIQKLFKAGLKNAEQIFGEDLGSDGGWWHQKMVHSQVFDKKIFSSIRAGFGDKFKFFVGGGAPLDLEYQLFFKYLGMPVMQGYGLTESSPVISCNHPEHYRFGSSGQIFDWLDSGCGGDYTFLDDDGNMAKDIHGQLLVKGDCVMAGYWNHSDGSAKALQDGWLHTGDMGYVDKDGFLYIKGRKGNMIVLFGGEKLHPEHVEDVLKNSEIISEVMIIGEGMKNVYACINVSEDTLKNHSKEELSKMLKAELKERCSHLANYQRPKDFVLLPTLTPADGTLTATMKIRRHKVWELHGDRINAFLAQAGEA